LCTWQKDWSFLLPILPRKVHFCMNDWHTALFWLCFFPSNEYNDGHQCLWQGLFLVLETNDCVHWKKTGHYCSQICREKSIFESMIGAWHFVGWHFPFKRVQQWPSMPTTRIACC
jgi:hypothetical protein